MTILQTDQAVQMHKAMNAHIPMSSLMAFPGIGFVSPYIVLNVTRDNIVRDTIRELAQYRASDLKKPLRVRFIVTSQLYHSILQ
jgi:E3 ubiquitin-protein ligase HERC4